MGLNYGSTLYNYLVTVYYDDIVVTGTYLATLDVAAAFDKVQRPHYANAIMGETSRRSTLNDVD